MDLKVPKARQNACHDGTLATGNQLFHRAPELEFFKLTVWSADMQKLDIQSRRMIISPVATQVPIC